MNPVVHTTLWLAFFGLVLAAWGVIYSMWIGVIPGNVVWLLLAAFIAAVQLALLLAVGPFLFTRSKEICHGIWCAPMKFSNSIYWSGPDFVAAPGLNIGVWDLGGKSAEGCLLNRKGTKS